MQGRQEVAARVISEMEAQTILETQGQPPTQVVLPHCGRKHLALLFSFSKINTWPGKHK